MHPLLQGRVRIVLYVCVWIGITAVLTMLVKLIHPRPLVDAIVFMGPLAVIYASVCLSAWYVCRSNPIGGIHAERLIGIAFGSASQAALLWTGIAALWGMFIHSRLQLGPDRAAMVSDLVFVFMAGLILYLEALVAHYAVLAFESARAAERRLLESQVTAREAELRALRAQLNPHFLFNSLNSISALTGPNPEAARHMCQLLGDFLRTSLSLGARERVPLAEELGLAERYLSIERVRFGERLSFEKTVAPDADRCLVPPLLIQPLVENAVKHGVADRVEGGCVQIQARRVGDSLEVAVENPRDPEAPSRRGSGLGLENVRQRLAALDPRGTRVDVVTEPERFRVVLTLPVVDSNDGAKA